MPKFFSLFSGKNEATAVSHKELRKVYAAAEEIRSRLESRVATLTLAARDATNAAQNAELAAKREELIRLQEAIKASRDNNNLTNFARLKNLVLPPDPLSFVLPANALKIDDKADEEEMFTQEELKSLELSESKLPVVLKESSKPAAPIAPSTPAAKPVVTPPAKLLKVAEEPVKAPPPAFVAPKTQIEVKEREIPVNQQIYTETVIKANKGKDQIIHKAEGESLSTQNRQKTIMSMVHENLYLYGQNIYLRANSEELINQTIFAILTVESEYKGKIHITGFDEKATNERVAAIKKELENANVKSHFAKILQEIESLQPPAAQP